MRYNVVGSINSTQEEVWHISKHFLASPKNFIVIFVLLESICFQVDIGLDVLCRLCGRLVRETLLGRPMTLLEP